MCEDCAEGGRPLLGPRGHPQWSGGRELGAQSVILRAALYIRDLNRSQDSVKGMLSPSPFYLESRPQCLRLESEQVCAEGQFGG